MIWELIFIYLFLVEICQLDLRSELKQGGSKGGSEDLSVSEQRGTRKDVLDNSLDCWILTVLGSGLQLCSERWEASVGF